MKQKKSIPRILMGALLILTLCGCETGEAVRHDGGQTDWTVPTETVTPIPTEEILLVNSWCPISDSYAVDVKTLPNGQKVAAECYEDLTMLLADCSAEGLKPEVCSGFRTIDFQQSLYEDKVQRVMEDGHTREDAERIAATEVAAREPVSITQGWP